MQRKSSYHLMVYIAMLAAQAVVISLIERAIPAPFAFAPGAKLGLANLITIIALFTLPFRYSFQVVTLRLIVTTLLGGTLSTFIYSFFGAYLSYFVMLSAKKVGPSKVSVIGISTLGGIFHNIGQLVVAATFAKSWAVLNYLPILAFSGILAGFTVGFVGNYLLHKVKRLQLYHDLQRDRSQQNWLTT
ncbi:MAG: Gx transporter family protein [Aerococcaceae bacterium]|nr:Gx transporter family protein [Aerococcaceae bacterium]